LAELNGFGEMAGVVEEDGGDLDEGDVGVLGENVGVI
jgi:hypothetical protein